MALIEYTPNQMLVFGLIMGWFIGAIAVTIFCIYHFRKFVADLPTKEQVAVLRASLQAMLDKEKEIQQRWDRGRR